MISITLSEYYEGAKEKIVNQCIECGNCITNCRALKLTEQTLDVRSIQRNIIEFLSGKKPLASESSHKVNACMGCFGCLDVPCAIGVPSMHINELIKWAQEEKKETYPIKELYATHFALAREGTSQEEYQRITSLALKDSETLFFPGCNIYNQPRLLLNAMAILDEIGNAYSFAPGLEYCCGMNRGCLGDAAWAEEKALELMTLCQTQRVKTMIFWCPTCLCVLEDRIKKFYQPTFRCISFGQYVYENISKLTFPAAQKHRVTYHEPCKTAYMDIKLYVREVLKSIPGTELIEMAHHGKNTICCGCEAVNTAPEIGNQITEIRFEEAAATNCEVLIDTCHYCHWIFKNAAKSKSDNSALNFKIENYATYIARAMGKSQADMQHKGDE